MRILVVGATGSIGLHVVAEGLARGHQVRALVRDPRRARLTNAVELVGGDLTNPASLPRAVDGIDAIVFAHGSTGGEAGARDVFYAGVRDVIVALAGRHVPVALMTAIGVTDRGRSHDWKRRAERLVRASGLLYVIVRPGWFDMNAPDQLRLVALQGDRRRSGTPRDGVVSRRQIAEVLVHGLGIGGPPGRTFELIAEKGSTQTLDALFAAVELDDVGQMDGVKDEANMPLQSEPETVLDDLSRIQAVG